MFESGGAFHMKLKEIYIRDPFVLSDPKTNCYYLYGTTGIGNGIKGFDCYRSQNLTDWEGPFPIVRQEKEFASTKDFWAAEVFIYQGGYYLMAAFKGAAETYRGVRILRAANAAGPYAPIANGAVTPKDWECLDGSLYIDKKGDPWLVFCHEWVQIYNGAVYAMPLSKDLRASIRRPVFLFNASEAPWIVSPTWAKDTKFPVYVTDAPFLYRTRTGVLLMLWSSFCKTGYCVACARSENGEITGDWVQQEQLLWDDDGGHAHIFRGFDGKLYITFHGSNATPREWRPFIFELEDHGDFISIKKNTDIP